MVTDTGVRTIPPAQSRPARRRLPTWLVGSAAVGWLAFVVLHRVLAGRVWWWGPAELLPPLAFVVVPVLLFAAVPLAAAARWRLGVLVLAAVLIGAGLSGLNPAALWHRSSPVPSDAITVFSWNTWYWDQRAASGRTMPPPGGTPSAETEEFYRFLHAQAADVYLLQEYVYFGDDSVPIRVDDLDMLRREFPDHHIAATSELVTLSRFPIVLKRGLDLLPWLPDRTDVASLLSAELPGYYTVKTLRTDLLIDGVTISFYNAHVTSPVDPAYSSMDPRRFGPELQPVRRAGFEVLAADIEDSVHPVVLAGDLNTSPAMGLLGMLPDRLTDPTPEIGSLYPTSWDDRSLRLWRIDWAFTTSDLAVHRYRLVPSAGLSDHSGQHLAISVTR